MGFWKKAEEGSRFGRGLPLWGVFIRTLKEEGMVGKETLEVVSREKFEEYALRIVWQKEEVQDFYQYSDYHMWGR